MKARLITLISLVVLVGTSAQASSLPTVVLTADGMLSAIEHNYHFTLLKYDGQYSAQLQDAGPGITNLHMSCDKVGSVQSSVSNTLWVCREENPENPNAVTTVKITLNRLDFGNGYTVDSWVGDVDAYGQTVKQYGFLQVRKGPAFNYEN